MNALSKNLKSDKPTGWFAAFLLALSLVLHAMTGLTYACRFQPTCREYFLQALKTHGLLRGFLLGVGRLLRCHPWGKCGIDPVPTGERYGI